jgi:ABC-type transport system involved in multi-copper enzyme maturation permease subunit
MTPIGPILGRELRTVARRPRTFRRRCSFSIAILLLLGLTYLMESVMNRGQISPRFMAAISESVFANIVLAQILLTIFIVPACVAVAIAEEKERRTLTDLLTTRLTSAEIVFGKLAAGLVQYAAWLATGLPIMILLPLLGGVDPRWVLLAAAGTASTAYFVGGLSIVISTAARSSRKAVGEAIGLASIWLILPALCRAVMPFRFPRLWPWVQPGTDWVLASSPSGVLFALWGIGPGWPLYDSTLRMIGLQLAGGSLLLVWAIGRFRAACRHEGDTEGDTFGRSPWPFALWTEVRRRFLRRSPCRENPMLWKELQFSRPRTFAEILAVLVALVICGALTYATFSFARPAFGEQFKYGSNSPGPDLRRTEFNQFVRHVTSLVEFFTLLIAAGIATTGLTEERARETWDSLLATPLRAGEIIGAKILGAAWKVRWGVLILIALWSVGVLAGSIHLFGFCAALLLLAASVWFMTALGTYASLVSRDTGQASNWTLIPVLLLSGSFLACYLLPPDHRRVVLGAGSAPFVNYLALVSPPDVREIVYNRGQKQFGPIRQMGLSTGERPWAVLATFLLTTVASTSAAAWLSRAAVARFDRAAGRPCRSADIGDAGPGIGDVPDVRHRGPIVAFCPPSD